MNPSRAFQYLLLLLGFTLLVLTNTLFITSEDTQPRGANIRDYGFIALDTLPGFIMIAIYSLVLTGRHLNNNNNNNNTNINTQKQRQYYWIHVACRVMCTLAIIIMVCYLPILRIVAMKQALAYDPSMEGWSPSPPMSANATMTATTTTTTAGPWTFQQMYFCDKMTYQALGPSFASTCVKHLVKTGVSLVVVVLLVVELAVAGVWGDLRRRSQGDEVKVVVVEDEKKMPMEDCSI